MNQSFIDALMHFFSLFNLPLPGRKIDNILLRLEDYITKAGIAFPVEECLKIYNTYSGKYFFELSSNAYREETDLQQIQRHLILEAGQKAQENLFLQERVLLILSLMEFNLLKNNNDAGFHSYINDLSRSLNVNEKDFIQCENFISGKIEADPSRDLILEERDESEELEGEWINRNTSSNKNDKKKRLREKVKSNIRFHLFDTYVFIAFIYNGDHSLFINEKRTYPGYFYSFRRKDILQFEGLEPITFEEIEEHFEINSLAHKIILSGKNLSYRYEKTHYSIKPFSFYEESGQIIGIIGNNGVGKSTILKLVSNQLAPQSGKLFINGADMAQNKYRLRPVTAYVPQAPREFKELTVFENFLFQAHLTLGNLGHEDIVKRIDATLEKLSLTGIRNVRADNAVGQSITDFQRICLRIGLELIRNPYIIYLDEPLSGLSFSDSKKIISILKEETQQGKLVILTTQLPTTDIYNMFDKVWLIDSDGYMIFNGPPSASLVFFRNTGLLPYYYIQAKSDLVNAEDVFKIVETKKIHTDGSISDERQVTPGTWYDAWKAESEKEYEESESELKPLPVYSTGLPGIEKQFIVYFLRNLRIKWPGLSFAGLHLLGVPVVCALIAIVSYISVPGEYSVYSNELIPMSFYLVLNVILLTSLLSASEEIYNEKLQIERDNSLSLSLFSYKNAKVLHIFILSLLQSVFCALVLNSILGLENLTLSYSLIFFSVAASGNLLSLSLSGTFTRLTSIYIIIPFLVIPNIMFSGYLISFNSTKLTANLENPVPVIADLCPGRWAYEAMIVEQFTKNAYNSYFFDQDKKRYQSEYILHELLPLLGEELSRSQAFKYISPNADSLSKSLTLLSNEINLLSQKESVAPFESLSRLQPGLFDSTANNEVFGYLTYLRFLMENFILDSESAIRETVLMLEDSLGNPSLEDFKKAHQNSEIEKLLLMPESPEEIQIRENHFVKKGSPVYLDPESRYGRSHFFASQKKLNNQLMSTLRYNITCIWILNLFLYILFLSDGLNRTIRLFKN